MPIRPLTCEVLGSSFVIGGTRRHEQVFNSTTASTMSSLMTLASASFIIPTTFAAFVTQSNEKYASNLLILSHGTALVLLVLYFMYLFFQLHTHPDLFDAEPTDTPEERSGGTRVLDRFLVTRPALKPLRRVGPLVSTAVEPTDAPEERSGETQELQTLGPIVASLAIILQSTIVAVCAIFLISSIQSIVETPQVSKNFFGIFLIPIIGNVAEYSTTCVAAWRNRMDLVLNLAIGNSMQIALFVTPFLVILGWIIGQPMTFNFSDFEAVMFFVSVIIVVRLIQDGKSNYLEGIMCLGV
jgi:Ca2+:H+ antiporter